MIKKLLLAAALILAPVAAIAQLWPAFPQVDGPSYCAATNNNVCTQTVPAGPAMTGNETVPADTNLAGGGQPQTVKIPMILLGGDYQYNAPLTGASITVLPTTGKLVLDPAGTIATLTVVFPASTLLTDGQSLEIGSSNTVTALTITPGSGTTVAQTPTAITVSTTASYGLKFIYMKAVTKWIRTQ